MPFWTSPKLMPYLPECVAPVQPLFCDGVPTRRLRSKTSPPPATATLSVLHIEGEKRILEKYDNSSDFALPPDAEVPSESSWTMGAAPSPLPPLGQEREREVHDAPLAGHDDERDGDGGRDDDPGVNDLWEEETNTEEDWEEALDWRRRQTAEMVAQALRPHMLPLQR